MWRRHVAAGHGFGVIDLQSAVTSLRGNVPANLQQAVARLPKAAE